MPVQDAVSAVAEWTDRAPAYQMFRDYYDGRHRWSFASPAFLQKFQWVLEQARENLCPTVVSAFVDKLEITSWDGSGAETAGKLYADRTLRLGQVMNLAHTEAYRCGDAYVLAWQTRRDSGPRPFFHRADQMVPRTSGDDPYAFDWVAKVWIARNGHGRVNVYYADRVERFETTDRIASREQVRDGTWYSETEGRDEADGRVSAASASSGSIQWPDSTAGYRPYEGDNDPDTIRHAFGRVPVVHVPRDPDTQGGYGRSILTDVVPLQDALNKSVADLIVGGESFAQPLRYLMNYEGEKRIDPETGKVTETKLEFDETRNRIFGVRGPGPFGQLDPPDATRLTAVQDAYAMKIARVVGIPSYYMTQTSGDVPSGQSLRVLSSRLTAGVGDFQQDATNPWSDLLDLLGAPDALPVWAPAAPSSREEELAEAQIKQDLGFPFGTVATELGYGPDQLVEIERERVAEEAAATAAGQAAARALRDGRDVRDVLG